MRERELATLLIQMGVDSGMEIERAAEELASVAFPSFVNARSFRAVLLESVEAQMRVQMEQRLQAMRQRFDVPDSPGWSAPTIVQPMDSQPITAPRPPADNARGHGAAAGKPPADAGTLDTIVGDMSEEAEGTSDDTIVWSPRRD